MRTYLAAGAADMLQLPFLTHSTAPFSLGLLAILIRPLACEGKGDPVSSLGTFCVQSAFPAKEQQPL